MKDHENQASMSNNQESSEDKVVDNEDDYRERGHRGKWLIMKMTFRSPHIVLQL